MYTVYLECISCCHNTNLKMVVAKKTWCLYVVHVTNIVFLLIPVILDVLVYSLHLTLVYIFSFIVFLGYIQSSGKKMKRRFIWEKRYSREVNKIALEFTPGEFWNQYNAKLDS